MLVGKYRLTRELGRGGMGAVYEAEHVRLGQKVAIKVVLPEVAKRPEIAHRFEREARAAARLRGRHTVRVLDIDVTPEGQRYLVMELLEGHSLRDELNRRGPLPVEDAVRYLREACEGVCEVHKAGIIHRDIKPANLFLSVEEGGSIVKVVDFGIAKAHGEVDTSFETSTNIPLGTCKYMSPEQAHSARSVDQRTDLWSLGVTLYELLARKAPFSGEGALGMLYAVTTQPPAPLRAARPDLPEALIAIVERALCKDMAGRYQSARELSDALAPFERVGASPPRHLPSQPTVSPPWGQQPSQPTVSPPWGQQPQAPHPARPLTPAHHLLGEAGPAGLETATTQPGWPPASALAAEARDESITSGAKSHVVPILPAGSRPAPSPWFARGGLALTLIAGTTLGYQAVRTRSGDPLLAPSPLAELASTTDAFAQALSTPTLAMSALPSAAPLRPPPTLTPSPSAAPLMPPPTMPPSSSAAPPLTATEAVSQALPPVTTEDVRRAAAKATSRAGAGFVAKAPAPAASAWPPHPDARPHEGPAHPKASGLAAAPSSAKAEPPKPQEPKETVDIKRFDEL
jgi:serine/threonine-protein kinase